MAYEYFEKAYTLAKLAGDTEYMSMIEADLNYVKGLLGNGK